MRKTDVSVGKVYIVKVSGKLVPVRLLNETSRGGWMGVNLNTDREIRIKTAGRLRREIDY